MATVVDLTQVQVTAENPVPTTGIIPGAYVIPDSSSSISINQTSIVGVGYFWDPSGQRILDGVVQVYIANLGVVQPIIVTDSYATIKGYITANP